MRLPYLLPFVLCASVAAQQSTPLLPDGRIRSRVRETEHLTIELSSSQPAKPGSFVSLFINIAPKPKMHVYAPGQENYIPVSVTLKPESSFQAHPPVFPRAEKYLFKPLNETQLVYSKPFRIVQRVSLADTQRSELTISGTVRYQACDDAICYLPKSVPVTWKLSLTRPAAIK